jgi:tripartite-type tricarboxylate transporter receptor subunit TctC
MANLPPNLPPNLNRLGTAGLVASSTASLAAPYPERTVRIIVPFAPGGPTDIMARVIAAELGERLKGTFIVENRPGAGGNIGMSVVAHATADGTTLMVMSSALVVNPGIYKSVPYDPFKDFVPIAELGASPNVFLTNPASGVTSIADLIAKAKADSKALVYASAGIGTTPHLSGEMLKLAAGIEMTHVSYNGAGPAIQALLSNSVPIACVSLPPARPLIAGGQLKALAVTGRDRWFDLPELPTMLELGYKDFITDTFQAFMAPAKTPPDIVLLLAATAVSALNDKTIRDRLQTTGFNVLANGPAGMAKRIADEVPKWRDLVAKAGIAPV